MVCAFAQASSAEPPKTEQGADSNGLSFLNRSFEAEEAIEKARRHLAAGRWDAAVQALQNIADRYGAFVVQSAQTRYISVGEFVHRIVCDGPADALIAYRRLYEKVARAKRDAAEATPGEADLLDAGGRFFPTHAAAEAIDEAAQRAVRRGEFLSAVRWYGRLAESHPDRSDLGSGWRAKQAVAQAFADGEATVIQKYLDSLDRQTKLRSASWTKTNQTLTQFLEDSIRGFSSPALRENSGDTGIFAGGIGRGAVFQCDAKSESQLWRSPLADQALSERAWDGYESPTARRDARLRALQSGRMLGAMPVAADGMIFLHDDRAVWAVDPEKADSPVWRFDLGEDTSRGQSVSTEDEPPPQFTTLAADGRVLAHLERALPESDASQIHSSSCLVCLDARSGRLLWRNNLEQFAKPFEQTRVDGAGLYHNGAYYVVVRRQKPFGFEACHLIRLNSETGKVQWSAHLGEAATGTYGYSRATLSHPALAGDLVFVASNLGTIAAVETSNGRIAWITTYPSKYATAANADGLWTERPTTPAKAWSYPAPIVWRDLVIAMPLDADHLYLLSRADGAVVHKEPAGAIGSPQTLLGTRNELLYTAGSTVVAYDLGKTRVAWQRPIADGTLHGRGALGSEGVYVPTDQALLQYSLDGGPAQVHRWSIEQAGNLLLLPDQVVVASPGSVYGLIDKQRAFDRWTRRVRDNPNDVDAPLYLAELALRSGDYARGLDTIEEAVRRMGGFAAVVEEKQRSRLFDRLMRFADDLDQVADKTDTAAGRNARIRLLQMAGNCPPGYLEQVVFRLRLAAALEEADRSIEAVTTCQQILVDRTLRGIRLKLDAKLQPPAEEVAPELLESEAQADAASLARQWIARLIKLHGPAVYQVVEKSAQERLRLAVANADAGALLEVTDSYPNSRAAKSAMSAHARMMAGQSRWADARRSYRLAIADADDSQRPELMSEFAGSLLAEGRTREAAAWLDRTVRDYPGIEIRHEGRAISFLALRERMLSGKSSHDPSQARLAWPVSEGYRRLFPDRMSILEPAFVSLPDTSWDALICFSNEQIEARHPATGRALWPAPTDCPVAPTLLGMDQTRLVFSTQFRLFALTRTSGQLAWEFGQEPPADPSIEPEASAAWTSHQMTASRVYAASDRGEVVCLELNDGQLRWRKTLDNQLSGQIVADERFVYLPTWQGRNHGLVILDAATGQVHKNVALGDGWPIQGLLPTTEGVVLAVFANLIAAIDPETGKTHWRAATADRMNLTTLQVDENGIYVSNDGRRITMYRLVDGALAWTSPPVTRNEGDGMWVQVSNGVLYAAGSDSLTALDATTGRQLWTTRQTTDVRVASPRIVTDSLLSVSRVFQTEADSGKSAAGEEKHKKFNYVIRRNRLSDGREQPVVGQGALTAGPAQAFDGIFPRDSALIVLDGNSLIGYVSKR